MMGRLLAGFVLALVLAFSAALTPCSPENRATDLETCLTRIKTVFIDPAAFWFGTNYSTRCPQGTATPGVSCTNARPNNVDSMATRLLRFNASLLTAYLDMTFTSLPGQYSGCGNNFSTTEVKTFHIDPVATDITYPWDLRHLPALNWTYTAGDRFTLVIYDVGNLITHGVYTNILGTDIASAEAVDPYHGPLATRDLTNPYAFMLFNQEGFVNVSQEWRTKLASSMGVMILDDFIANLSLSGPVAMNWVRVKGDVYAAGVMRSRGVLNMCPLFIGKALAQESRPFLPSPIELSVSVDITFGTPSIPAYTVCCKSYDHGATTFDLNPLGNPVYNTADVRSEANLTISLLKDGIVMFASNFTGEMYSLIALDPDVPSPTVGTQERPLLHMMTLNFVNGDVSTGDTLLPYSGPSPPDTVHTYYFLLYRHSASISEATARSYQGNCSIPIRCLYDISGLVRDNNMTLVGATWLRSTRDDYVNFRYINRGDNPDTVCAGQPGYSNPCPTAAASKVTMATLVIYLFVSVVHFVKLL